jgi:hypothetical protein
MYGEWRTSATDYVTAVQRYDTHIGRLEWAAPQDWMCEPIITAKTGLTVEEHQRRTVASFIELRTLWQSLDMSDESRSSPEFCPFVPVLQGWELADYTRCVQMYADAGINLSDYPMVGVGSVCRRQATDEIGEIFEALSRFDIAMHGFGVKRAGLALYGHLLASADSMAWSYAGRRDAPMEGCVGHINCANCMRYALQWREGVMKIINREEAFA